MESPVNGKSAVQAGGFDQPMVARIEFKDFGSAVAEKEISDALQRMEGVRDVTIAKGAVHVTYDPLLTSEKQIGQTIAASGHKVTAAAAEREIPHPPAPAAESGETQANT